MFLDTGTKMVKGALGIWATIIALLMRVFQSVERQNPLLSTNVPCTKFQDSSCMHKFVVDKSLPEVTQESLMTSVMTNMPHLKFFFWKNGKCFNNSPMFD